MVATDLAKGKTGYGKDGKVSGSFNVNYIKTYTSGTISTYIDSADPQNSYLRVKENLSAEDVDIVDTKEAITNSGLTNGRFYTSDIATKTDKTIPVQKEDGPWGRRLQLVEDLDTFPSSILEGKKVITNKGIVTGTLKIVSEHTTMPYNEQIREENGQWPTELSLNATGSIHCWGTMHNANTNQTFYILDNEIFSGDPDGELVHVDTVVFSLFDYHIDDGLETEFHQNSLAMNPKNSSFDDVFGSYTYDKQLTVDLQLSIY